MSKNRFIKIGIWALLFLIIISRIEKTENSICLEILSKDNYFYFQKHTASKSILKFFKNMKKMDTEKITYVDEASDCLLYTNSNDIFEIITEENGVTKKSLYKPEFKYTIDGKYVVFIFEDQFLKYVDEIIMRLINEEKEICTYSIPINTNLTNCSVIIKIEELKSLNPEKTTFEIVYTHNYGDFWKLALGRKLNAM